MNIRITTFEASEREIRFVRDTVFGGEQDVPRELDWDIHDPDCVHAVATDESDNPIGTGRVLPDGRIGRLAVLKPWRGRGIGGEMLEALVQSARRRGLDEVYLHAQVHAMPFYEKSRFKQDGDEFVEAGIKHVNMTRETRPEH